MSRLSTHFSDSKTRKHLLIAGDQGKSFTVLKNTLAAFASEFTVDSAGNYNAIISASKKRLPDLIILDYETIGSNAINTAGSLRKSKLTGSVPVIMTTDFSSSGDIQKAIDVGVIDFIRKPVERSELLILIKTVTEHNRLLMENIMQANELKKLSLIVNSSDNSIIIYNVDGKIEWVNNAFEKIYGCTPEDYEKKCSTQPELKKTGKKFSAALTRCRKDKTWATYEHSLIGENGEVKWLHTSITPVCNDSGKIENFIAVETEITGMKLAETRLIKQNNDLIKLTVNLEQANKKLGEQRVEIQNKKKEIEDQKKISDNLLLNLFPYEIAEQLKLKGTAVPKHYRMASVMFTDFVGFSKLTEITPVHELIRELNMYFEKFDEIIKAHFLEKIKTMGDSYMCAGGIPLRNRSNPIDTVLAALEILEFVNRLNRQKKKEGRDIWEIRIGIHTGEVIAGVIGRQKMGYDIWGRTVNTASQMESKGKTEKINISETTYMHIKDYFDCTHRGKISVKHHDQVDMYFVNGLKPEYSTDKNRCQPNGEFKKILAGY